MSFPSKVRDQLLVAAARHCCACHRYKGVKLEIHHIKQKKMEAVIPMRTESFYV